MREITREKAIEDLVDNELTSRRYFKKACCGILLCCGCVYNIMSNKQLEHQYNTIFAKDKTARIK